MKNPSTVSFSRSRHLPFLLQNTSLGILHTRSVYVKQYVTRVTVRVFKVHKRQNPRNNFRFPVTTFRTICEVVNLADTYRDKIDQSAFRIMSGNYHTARSDFKVIPTLSKPTRSAAILFRPSSRADDVPTMLHR